MQNDVRESFEGVEKTELVSIEAGAGGWFGNSLASKVSLTQQARFREL